MVVAVCIFGFLTPRENSKLVTHWEAPKVWKLQNCTQTIRALINIIDKWNGHLLYLGLWGIQRWGDLQFGGDRASSPPWAVKGSLWYLDSITFKEDRYLLYKELHLSYFLTRRRSAIRSFWNDLQNFVWRSLCLFGKVGSIHSFHRFSEWVCDSEG